MTEKDLIIQRLRRDIDELEEKLDVFEAFEAFLREGFGEEDFDKVCKLFAAQYKGGTGEEKETQD